MDVANATYDFAVNTVPDKKGYYMPYDIRRQISNILSIFVSLLDLQVSHLK